MSAQELQAHEAADSTVTELSPRAQAQLLVQDASYREAIALLLPLVRAQPSDIAAWLLMLDAVQGQSGLQSALELALSAVAQSRGQPRLRVRAAMLLEQAGRHAEAALQFQTVLEQAPEHATTLHRILARARMQAGDLPRALDSLRLVLAGPQASERDWLVFGQCCHRLGLAEIAQRAFSRVASSADFELLMLLADTVFQQGLWNEASVVLARAASLFPGRAEVWFALARAQVEDARMSEAQASLQQVAALEPSHPGLLALQGAMAARMGDAAQACALFAEQSYQQPEQLAPRSSTVFSALHVDGLDADALADMHKAHFGGNTALGAIRPGYLDSPAHRLRVGYLSAGLQGGQPICSLMLPVLQQHNRSRLEVFVYNNGQTVDAHTQRAREAAEHWRDVASLSDAQLKALMAADGIDLLVDLCGHTAPNRMGLLMQRAAPVQATLLGYPFTTGLGTMDWLIADVHTVPGADEALYSEQIARLPASVFCYRPEDDYPLVVRPRSRPGVVFGSFNNLTKLTDTCVAAWAEILQAVPHAGLLLKAPSLADPAVCAHTMKRLVAAGIAPQNVELRGPSPLPAMMAEYADVDVALDPLPCNGGITSAQALWMGVPLVSLQDRGFARRMGASLLHTLDRSAWVASSVPHYVEKAVALGEQGMRALSDRQALRAEFAASPLHNIGTFVPALETLYQDMLAARLAQR